LSISRDDVVHVAKLARLGLSEDEIGLFAEQLSAVVGYVDQIAELDLDDVPPTAHPVELTNVFREDVVKQSLSQAEVLANAPEQEDGAFVVPKIVQ